MNHALCSASILTLSTAAAIALSPGLTAHESTTSSLDSGQRENVRTFLGQPLSFERNQGQAPGAVRFVQRGPRHLLALDAEGWTLALHEPNDESEGANVRFEWVAGAPDVEVLGEDPLVARKHFLTGNDEARWTRDVELFRRVRLPAIYAGIDLVLHGDRGALEYDFVVAPRKDPTRIGMRARGASRPVRGAHGEVVLETAAGPLVLDAPVAYQGVGPERRAVECEFLIDESGAIRFALGAYDVEETLVIDPVMLYGTYLGGSGSEFPTSAVADAAGSLYICGETLSSDFPTTDGALDQNVGGGVDVFVAKLDPSGNLQWATYLGGSNHSGTASVEIAQGLAVDTQGQVFVTGSSNAYDFPTTSGAYNVYPPAGGFVSKLSANGSSLVYSTLLHRANGYGIEVDPSGYALVAGEAGNGFATTNGAYDTTFNGFFDAFVLKLDPAGTGVAYSTLLGGTGLEYASDIELMSDGSVLVCGNTDSAGFPTTVGAFDTTINGSTDAFMSRLSADGSTLLHSTFVGGAFYDWGLALDLDSSGLPVLVGATYSGDFPTTAGAFQTSYGGGMCDAYVTGLSHDLSALRFSTFVGGSDGDGANAVDIDSAGQIVVAGFSSSTDFPVTSDAWSGAYAGVADTVLFYLDPSAGSLNYGTYYGGAHRENTVGVAVAPDDSVWVVGNTQSSDLPVTSSAIQASLQGSISAFAVRFSDAGAASCVGSGGFAPALTLQNAPIAGQQLGLTVSQGLGGSSAVFFFGAGLANVPMNADCFLRVAPLFPASFAVPLSGSGPGTGSVTLAGVLPASLAGSQFAMQVFVPDVGAPAGFSNTNAVLLQP